MEFHFISLLYAKQAGVDKGRLYSILVSKLCERDKKKGTDMISVIRWRQTCMDILSQVQTPVQTHKSDEHDSLEFSCELPFTLDDPHDGLDHL